MDEVPGARPVAIPMAAILVEGIDVVHPTQRLIGARTCLQVRGPLFQAHHPIWQVTDGKRC